jgi:hypothetical protein
MQALQAPQGSRLSDLTGQQLLDEVQKRWSYARSLLPLRIVKEDLVDAFKHIGFPLSPAQATELWRGLSDAVSLRANSRTETFLDKSDIDRILSLRTTSEKSDIDLAARGKKASRVSARNQQNISENIFSFASEQPRPQPRPLSAMCVQPGRVRSTYDPTDLFGGKPAPPNVFLRVRKHVSRPCDVCVDAGVAADCNAWWVGAKSLNKLPIATCTNCGLRSMSMAASTGSLLARPSVTRSG